MLRKLTAYAVRINIDRPLILVAIKEYNARSVKQIQEKSFPTESSWLFVAETL